ncbi:hypothetical protein DBB42_27445 [Pseudomonas plecoglossicida]|uniref:Uncharacterized protein n=1 Tax=Pseudomonas plecoglossicida TaxID=70775 RepID=A0A2R7UEE5_PSEDL|nr:hypothetical protein DBB42_27445 [Pseudomonas plecoglossicida]
MFPCYRSPGASFAGAALCCEEADTGNRYELPAPASSQHKAAPTSACARLQSCTALSISAWPPRSARLLDKDAASRAHEARLLDRLGLQ